MDTHPLQRRRSDFIVEWFSGQGGGGQHRNKHQNCCRITDRVTKLQALGTESRSRKANQRMAFKRLVTKLQSYYAPEAERRGADNTEIRKYHHVDNYILDHASRLRTQFSDDALAEHIPARKRATLQE